MLENRIFVVSNIDLFIQKIREKIKKNKGYIITGPPKPFRHLHQDFDSYLSYIDCDFRKSLFLHYRYLRETGTNEFLCKRAPLTYEKHFSSKRINKNLGFPK